MSTPPLPYTRKANFVSYETPNPTKPKRGTDLDAEFDDIKRVLDGTQSRLAEIQRADGKLANGSVHKDALDPIVLAGIGGDPAGAIEALDAIRDDAQAAASASAGSASTASTAASTATTKAAEAAASALAADGAAEARVQSLVDEQLTVEGGADEPSVMLRDAVVRAASSGRGGTVAFVFDEDG